jgi:hypothetical protein
MEVPGEGTALQRIDFPRRPKHTRKTLPCMLRRCLLYDYQAFNHAMEARGDVERGNIPKWLFSKQGLDFSTHVLHERPLLTYWISVSAE